MAKKKGGGEGKAYKYFLQSTLYYPAQCFWEAHWQNVKLEPVVFPKKYIKVTAKIWIYKKYVFYKKHYYSERHEADTIA